MPFGLVAFETRARSQPSLRVGPKSPNGKEIQVYAVGKRDSYVIVAQLSPEFTARLVDRWQELETQAAAPTSIPQTYAEALRLAADQSEKMLWKLPKQGMAAATSSWLRARIEKYGFVENHDFVCSPVLGSKGRGGHNAIDYHLTIDMAKELAMVENNDKGRVL